MGASSKLMTAAEAITRFVSSGSSISLGGFTINRNPMALVHEIIRQGIGNLHIMMHSGSQALDLLIGARLVNRLEIAYGANGRFAPTCVRFRMAVESRSILVEDYTNFQMALRFLAGSMGIPYIPTYSGLGTDLVKKWGFSRKDRQACENLPKEKLVITTNPFNSHEEKLVLVPAANPDVTLLHVQEASPDGMVRIEGLSFSDIEQARSANHVIVTCEVLSSSEDMRKEPWRNSLPHLIVDAVVHQPYGAHPTACHLHYDYDAEYLNDYVRIAGDDTAFDEYLDRHIRDIETFHDYIRLIGSGHLNNLLADKDLGYAKRGK